MLKKIVIIFAIVSIATGVYFYFIGLPDPSITSLGTARAKIGDGNFTLYTPINDEGMQKGLSIFKSLQQDHGMLFRGLPVGTQTFWMKDMKFNIDILWVNKDNQIIHIVYDASKDSYPQKFSNPPGTASAYVIELNSGMCDKFGISAGTVVAIL